MSVRIKNKMTKSISLIGILLLSKIAPISERKMTCAIERQAIINRVISDSMCIAKVAGKKTSTNPMSRQGAALLCAVIYPLCLLRSQRQEVSHYDCK